MNYIKRLEAENAILQQGLTSIQSYLHLPKFHADPYVNVDDIFLRIQEIRSAVLDVEFES